MINSKYVLTATTVLGIFGLGWLIMPDAMGSYWQMTPGENFNYMGSRYGVLLIGLAVTVWLGRHVPNTQAKRALMMGAFVSLVLTTALSLYGALALGLNAWTPFIVELVLTLGLAWVLFIKPEPIV
jgi:cell division protein FtsW (lipid II flippase)